MNQFDFTDCCEVWRQIKPAFGWFGFVGIEPDVRIMPYITGDDGEQWRVNHCPSCGAERRNAAMRIEEQKSA